ncbi:MAG: ATP-dependent DNA helicase RecG [Gammaproteobacteria bacterium]
MSHREPLHSPVTALTGIGSQTAARLQKLGIVTIQDLLFHLPQRYQDKTQIHPIGALIPGMTALVCGTVEFTDSVQRSRNSVICRISDASGLLSLRFFHFSAQQLQQLKPGVQLSGFGEVRQGFNGLEMIHPEYKVLAPGDSPIEESLTPVYPLTEGVSQITLRKAVKKALILCLQQKDSLIDWLPSEVQQTFNYPPLSEALKILHHPPAHIVSSALENGESPALKRLAFEELLAHHLALLLSKQEYKKWKAPVIRVNADAKQRFLSHLPFHLTAAQKRVILEVETDFDTPQPMLRLVQGDVGSGKTLVAAVAALNAIHSGYQAALMAPTELLAEQHYQNFRQWFAHSGVQVTMLTGQMKGKSRDATLQAMADGSADIIVGTHALFQDSVQFHKLGLVIIDEQHRFGVQQRLALRAKGHHIGIVPHQLVMTATPIPRTLAMLQYSDVDISIIDELPPGRKPVTTSVIPSDRRDEVIDRLGQWIKRGHQAYWVCTLIEDSEQLQCEAAEKTAEYLQQALPEVRVGLIHGRMKAAEKDTIMQAFKNGDCQLLVATTVIEVGVDVPNAGLMVIENPERLGLSQLHQLRGRVGRGQIDSFCLLLYQSPLSQAGKDRLQALRANNDGFTIADIDLKLRGPGEIIGNRQTGQIHFKIANLLRDQDLLDPVQESAQIILHRYPETIHPLLERWLDKTQLPENLLATVFSP